MTCLGDRGPSAPAARYRQVGTRVAAALGGAATALALLPGTAAAHVKYFEGAAPYPLRPDPSLLGPTALAAGAAAAIGTGLLVQRLVGSASFPDLAVFRRMSVGAPAVLAVNTGVALGYVASTGALLAPQLRVEQPVLAAVLGLAQWAIAISFITGVGDWLGALALAALWLVGLALFPRGISWSRASGWGSRR